MNEQELQEAEAQIQKAQEMVSALCKPRGTEGSREWIMHIPAQPHYDPDLVIGEGLRWRQKLIDEVRRLHAEIKCTKAVLDGIAEFGRPTGFDCQVPELAERVAEDFSEVFERMDILIAAIKEQIEISNCTWDFVDGLTLNSEEDKEVLMTMVTVPGLKDALTKLEHLDGKQTEP